MLVKNKKFLTYTSLSLLLIILILVNVLSNIFFSSLTLDFTEQKIYTLSLGSKAILADIKEPISIKLYFSKKLARSYPYLFSYASRVQKLLSQYKRSSNDKLIIDYIDVEPFTEAEDQAVNDGLQGIPIDGNGTELYFGLVATNSLTNKEVISFFHPNREMYLEYDISQVIYKLIYPMLTKIGLFTDLPLEGTNELYFMQANNDNYPWVIWEQLKQSFELETINEKMDSIPNNINVLMMANTKDLSTQSAYMIDQFIMRGGHVLAFIDPNAQYSNIKNDDIMANKKNKSNLQKLLQSWGVSISANIFSCNKLSKKIKYYRDSKEYITNYPIFVDFTKKYFDKEDILTNNLEQLTFAATGIIEKEKDSKTIISPIIKSDGDNMLVDVDKLGYFKEYPYKLVEKLST